MRVLVLIFSPSMFCFNSSLLLTIVQKVHLKKAKNSLVWGYSFASVIVMILKSYKVATVLGITVLKARKLKWTHNSLFNGECFELK